MRKFLVAGASLGALLAAAAWAAGNDHIMVNPDDIKWAPGPKSLPAGAQVALLEGDPSKAVPITMRLKFPAGYRIPAHTHPVVEHVTVLSGAFHMGAGDKLDQSKGMRLGAGGFVAIPAGSTHYAWASEETVVQLHSVGPWGITYVNPADDPRKSN
jgi:quercetin dioxygenase-like cupin family protein